MPRLKLKSSQRAIKDHTPTQEEVIQKKFWSQSLRFVNCDFSYLYIGPDTRQTKQEQLTKFNLKKVVFVDCDFTNTNFKGVRGLSPENFTNPKNIATSAHLPKTVYQRFANTACAYGENTRQQYNKDPKVINKQITRKGLVEITNFFKPIQKNRVEIEKHKQTSNPTKLRLVLKRRANSSN